MKYYKGYPEEIKVDGQAVTLHDIERTMLSLYWDKTLCEGDKDHLMDQYKEERMRYLDSIYQPTEVDQLQLKKVERLFTDSKERMENVCQRLIKTELQKKSKDKRLPANCPYTWKYGTWKTRKIYATQTKKATYGTYFSEKNENISPIGDLCQTTSISAKAN